MIHERLFWSDKISHPPLSSLQIGRHRLLDAQSMNVNNNNQKKKKITRNQNLFKTHTRTHTETNLSAQEALNKHKAFPKAWKGSTHIPLSCYDRYLGQTAESDLWKTKLETSPLFYSRLQKAFLLLLATVYRWAFCPRTCFVRGLSLHFVSRRKCRLLKAEWFEALEYYIASGRQRGGKQ